ncbi:MAG: phosphoribosylformylglycinamidine synthase subunit PurL, partial [Acidobacteria bacterium]|nr:phosphoribosylformylglycinamidine synthase subunit PurL [Acidobacteriota bacterium]
TMASAEFDEASAEKRPAVQVGDPFMEKLLMEACLEVMQTGAVIGIQDMGAAGLTCATSEMSSRGGTGMDVEVTLVPQRESGMAPYEIMLSESQERMLLVVHAGREGEVEAIFDKWDLHAVRIGTVTATGRVRVHERGTRLTDIPASALTDEAPLYHRPARTPSWQADVQRLDLAAIGEPPSPQEAFDRLMASPSVASKRWAYHQFDHTVGTNTIAQPGTSAAVVRIKGDSRALAVSVDGNGRFCYLDPYRGAMLAVAESARNVACAGAEPIGATNNLNFGNPERPEIMWQFAEAVRGVGDACRALGIPITGGNVSLYNETEGRAIYPTPVLGVVGLLADSSRTMTRVFKSAGASILLLGDNRGELGGSEYLALVHGRVAGLPPALNLEQEAALERLVRTLVADGMIESAHDCAEGGLAVTIAEGCFDSGGRGVELDVPGVVVSHATMNVAATLFGESASRVVVSVARSKLADVRTRAETSGVPATVLGRVAGDRIRVAVDGVPAIDVPVKAAEETWASAIESRMHT